MSGWVKVKASKWFCQGMILIVKSLAFFKLINCNLFETFFQSLKKTDYKNWCKIAIRARVEDYILEILGYVLSWVGRSFYETFHGWVKSHSGRYCPSCAACTSVWLRSRILWASTGDSCMSGLTTWGASESRLSCSWWRCRWGCKLY